MSTILDSLKKSSDQRDNNSPSSMDGFNFSNKKKKSSMTLVYLLLILMTAVVLYFGYQYINRDVNSAQDQQSQNITQPNTEKTTTPPQNAATIKENKPSKVTNTGSVKATSVKVSDIRKLQKPDNVQTKQKIKTLNNEKQDIKAQALEKRIKMQSIADLNRQKSAPKVDNENNQQLKVATQTITEGQAKKQSLKNPPVVIPVVENTNNPIKTSSQKPAVKYPYVYQLPFSLRKEIPKFILNIHIFDKNPENRVVVLNGAKFVIDDMIDEMILVKDIIVEGVVLEFNDTAFLIPKL